MRNELFDEVRQDPKEWGRMAESAIGAHLVNSALTEGFKVYYWRERNNEVDFVLERRGKSHRARSKKWPRFKYIRFK